MRANKVICSLIPNIAELILQHRINVKPSFIDHLDDLRNEIITMNEENSYSQEILFYLVEN
jgi:hypothetical protein